MVLYAPAKSIVLLYKEKLESKLSNKNLRGVFKYFRQWTFKIRIYSKVIQQALVFLHKGSNSFLILLEQFVDSLEIYKYYWRVCVCLFVCVCVCVYVCVCVCVCTSIHREGFICLDQLDYQGPELRCVKDTDFLCHIPSSLR